MPQINLSTLNGRELRQLLDASRRRGDASLSYNILQEMAVRREHPEHRGPFMTLRPAGSRMIDVDLGEPDGVDDIPPMPNWRPPAQAAEGEGEAAVEDESQDESEPGPTPQPEPEVAAAMAAALAPGAIEPPPPLEIDRPLSLREDDPQPAGFGAGNEEDNDLRLEPMGLESRNPPRQGRFRFVAGFAVGGALGVLLGFGAGGMDHAWLSPLAASLPVPAATPAAPPPRPALTIAQTAAVSPAATDAAQSPLGAPDTTTAPPPVATAAVAPPAASASATAPSGPAPASEAPAAAKAPEPVATATASPPAPAKPELAKAEPVKTTEADATEATAAPRDCAGALTPADRTICGDAKLRRLQGELRQAYSQALAAHEDRNLLRERQLAWRDARNTVADPDKLTHLYEDRIRKLNAATAQAKAEH